MVDTKITDLTRFQLMFYTFIACSWPCEGNYVGLLFTLLVTTISNIISGDITMCGVPANHTVGIYTKIIDVSQFQEKLYTYFAQSWPFCLLNDHHHGFRHVHRV